MCIRDRYQGEEVAELAYPGTYQRTLLTVNFTSKPGDTVTEDEVEIAGTAEPSASIQVFLNGEDVAKMCIRDRLERAFPPDP